jgi:hypothetical protein
MNISTKSERLVDLGDVADVVAGASAECSLAGARRNAPACPPAPARRRTTSIQTPTSRATGGASATCGQRRYCRRARHRIGPRRTAAARPVRLWTRADSRRRGRPCSAGRETPRHHHHDQARAQGFIAQHVRCGYAAIMRWPTLGRGPRGLGGPRRGSRCARRSCRTAAGASPAPLGARHAGARIRLVF